MELNPYEAPNEPGYTRSDAVRQSWLRDKVSLLIVAAGAVLILIGLPYLVARWIIGP
jgi:hypothetical protein